MLVWRAAPSAAGPGVHGRIVDQTGDALPGVVVTLAQPGHDPSSHAAITDAAGMFAIDCPPGRYLLRAELSGFQPVDRHVDVTGEHPLVLDLTMPLSTFSEQVEVKAAPPPAVLGPPVPDAPETVTREVFDAGMLPNSQYDDALTLLPNVVRGPDGEISVAGARAPQSALFVDGVNHTDPIDGGPRLMLPLEAIDTMDVFAGGYVSSLGPATGGVTSIQTKAGANTRRMSATSFMPRVRFPDGKPRVESWEPNFGMSGPVVKGRLFASESLSYRYDVLRYDTMAGEEQNAFNAIMSWTRFDAQLSSTHRLTTTLSFDPQTTDHAGITAFRPSATVPRVDKGGWGFGLADHVVLGPSAVAELRVGGVNSRLRVLPQGATPFAMAHDITTGSYFDTQDLRGHRLALGGDVTWTGAARHVLKAGLAFSDAALDGSFTSDPVFLYRSAGSLAQRIDFTSPSGPAKVKQREEAVYVQDTWTPVGPLTVDAGVRLDRSDTHDQARLLPRGSWTLKLDGGRLTLLGSAGWFADVLPLRTQAFTVMPSRLVTTYGASGVALATQRLTNQTDGQLWMPLAERWDLEVDRQWGRGWTTRVRYQERVGRDEPVLTPISSSPDGLLLLTSTGRSTARSLEATAAYRAPGSDQQFYVSYVRSRATGDLNAFDLIEGMFRQAVVEPNVVAPLPADVPHRVMAWGVFHAPYGIVVAPFLEARSGFPYSAIDDNWRRVGDANGYRMPWYGSLDLYVNRVVSLPFHLPDARVGLKMYSIASVHTERDVQADIQRPDFGSTYNPVPRDFTVVLELLWGKK